MKTNTIKTAIVLLIVLIVAGILNAQKPKVKVVDDMDLIIEKSNQTMQKAASVSQKADQMVVAEVKEMKQTIEVLEEEKVALVEQVKTMQDEIVAIKSEPTALPFDVLAIGVPDTTSRK
jgi:prophage DNA circulation protein